MESTQFLGFLIGGLMTTFSFLGIVVGFMYKYIFKPQMNNSQDIRDLTLEIKHQNELQVTHNQRQDNDIKKVGEDLYIVDGRLKRVEDVVFKKDYA